MQALNQDFDRKVIVTGASGFIGSHLCQRLCKDGGEVHALSRTTHLTNTSSLRWWQGDLEDIATVRRIVREVKPATIFHLASYVTGARGVEFVLPTFRNSLVSTVNLLTAATENNCRRIVLVGSLEEPEPNSPEVTPCSPYAAAKWASSTYGRMFHKLYQTPVVLARVFMVYGPGRQDIRRLIPHVALSLLQGQTPKLTSGKRKIDWIYIDDVIEGLLATARAQNVEGCTLDLGSGVLVTIQDVVKQLVAMVDSSIEPSFGALPDRPLERIRAADIDGAYAKLGWRAVIPLEQGLARTVQWYREQMNASLNNVFTL